MVKVTSHTLAGPESDPESDPRHSSVTDSLVSTRAVIYGSPLRRFLWLELVSVEIQNNPAPQFNPRKEEDERATGFRRETQHAHEARHAQPPDRYTHRDATVSDRGGFTRCILTSLQMVLWPYFLLCSSVPNFEGTKRGRIHGQKERHHCKRPRHLCRVLWKDP